MMPLLAGTHLSQKGPSMRQLFALGLVAATLVAVPRARALDQATVDKLVAQVDERQKNFGDYKALIYMEQKERDKNDTILEAYVYRRDKSDKLVILITKPKEQAGQGYLKVHKNLFMYDPTVGKWERRTERERIAGTDARRNDFDQSTLHTDFFAKFVANEKLGRFDVYHLHLSQRPGADVPYPVIELWLDQATGNVLKRQEFALSGKLMRTTYYPQWEKLYSQSKGDYVYVPDQIRVYDEVQKGNSTTIVIRQVDLSKLDDSIFTKAFVESRSR